MRPLLNVSLLLALGCGSSAPAPAAPDTPLTDTTAGTEPLEDEDAPRADDEPAPPAAAPRGVDVQQMSRAPFEGAPTVRILSPRDGEVIRRGPVALRLEVRDWPLSPPPGRHVHVSVDGRREMAVSDVSGSIALDALYEEAIGEPLAEGSHVLRAFLGRADHESVKRDGAFATVVFHHRTRTRGFRFDASAPALIYGRPQGCASGRTRLLDFYLANVPTLSEEGYRVRWAIDDLTGQTTEWVPHRIDRVGPGVHQVELALVGPDGQDVEGSTFSRSFRVDADCPTYAVRAYQPTAAEDDDDEEGL